MNPKGYLSDEDFKQIYAKVPRLCVDLVIRNDRGILLALRKAEPFKGMWNLPGGTLYKGEKVSEAAIRIGKNEMGINVSPTKCLGYIEYLNEPRNGNIIHTVSVVMEAQADVKENQELKFFKELPENLVIPQKKFLEK